MMSVWSDLFSLKGLVSLSITTPLVIGALFKLRIRSAQSNIRRDTIDVQGIGHTVVTGGVRGSTVIGGQGHFVSLTQQRLEAALQPGDVLALGFWGWVCLIAFCLIVLLVPDGADIMLVMELLASFALPVIALVAFFDLQNSGERSGSALVALIFTGLISWMVLRNYDGAAISPSFGGLGFLPKYALSFRPSFDAIFLNGVPSETDFPNVLILASAAFGFAILVIVHMKIGFLYLAEERGVTHTIQVGLLSLFPAFSALIFASGFGLAIWKWRLLPQFVWAIVAQTLPFLSR